MTVSKLDVMGIVNNTNTHPSRVWNVDDARVVGVRGPWFQPRCIFEYNKYDMIVGECEQ